MLFDEINLDTITKDDELYVNVKQLYYHIYTAATGFIEEAKYIDKVIGGMNPHEKTYIGGLAQGMYSIALLLQQGKDEADVNNINTIEDFLKEFGDNV